MKLFMPDSHDDGERYYSRLLLFVIASLLWVCLVLVLKLSAERWATWHSLGFAEFFRRVHLPDPARYLRFLHRLAWMPSSDYVFLYFRQQMLLNVLVLAAVLLCRRRLTTLLSRLSQWLQYSGHRAAKYTVMTVVCLVAASLLFRTPTGFTAPGFWGWTYRDEVTTFKPTATINHAKVERLAREHPFLSQGIVSAHAQYLPAGGTVCGNASFLHFKDGEVLPWNYDLCNLVIPSTVMGQLDRSAERQTLVNLVKHSLDRRRAGKMFLLPLEWAMPNHSTYMPLSYREAPPAEQLTAISFWALTVHIDEQRHAHVVDAQQERMIVVD